MYPLTIKDLVLTALALGAAVVALQLAEVEVPDSIDMTPQVEVSCDDGATFDSGNGDGPDGTRGTGGGRGVRQVTT